MALLFLLSDLALHRHMSPKDVMLLLLCTMGIVLLPEWNVNL